MTTLDRRRSAAIALLTAGAGGLGGCALAPLHEQTVEFTVPHVAGTAVDVDARNGSITVRRGGGDVTVTATLRMATAERLGEASVTATRDASRALVVRADVPGGWRSREGVSFQITVPEALGVRAATGNGRIVIAGLSGEADLRTSNGRIEVEGHDGPVTARTSNGAVSGEGITGSVDAETSNGAIEVSLDGENAGPARLRTSNGAVRLEVGPAFAGDLDVDTSNGSIDLPEGEGVTVRASRRGSASLRFGEGEEASRIRTSNGSVRVRVRG